jgi:hypothetical protein
LLQSIGEELNRFVCSVPKILPFSNRSEPQQGHHGYGISTGLRAVVVVFHAQDEIFGISSALPKAAMIFVVEALDHAVGQRNGEVEMLGLQRRFIQFNDSAEHEGIAFKQLSRVTLPIAPAVIQRFRFSVP